MKARDDNLHVFSQNYEPVLCMWFVCPPRQHGQTPNQALLQPQHLCVGQTVSGAAQVADVPSHERGSRNARQEAQCAWEWQLCKLRRDVWQHLTPPPLSPSPPPLSPPCISIIVLRLCMSVWPAWLKNMTCIFSVLVSSLLVSRELLILSCQTIRFRCPKCKPGGASDPHLCVLYMESFDGIPKPLIFRCWRRSLTRIINKWSTHATPCLLFNKHIFLPSSLSSLSFLEVEHTEQT